MLKIMAVPIVVRGSPWYWYNRNISVIKHNPGSDPAYRKTKIAGCLRRLGRNSWASVGPRSRLRTQERRPGGLKRGKTAAAWQDYSWSWTACCLLNGMWSRKKRIFQIQRGVCVSLLESCPMKTESPNTLTRRSGCLLSCFHLSWNR